jgi:hypothetical protein
MYQSPGTGALSERTKGEGSGRKRKFDRGDETSLFLRSARGVCERDDEFCF